MTCVQHNTVTASNATSRCISLTISCLSIAWATWTSSHPSMLDRPPHTWSHVQPPTARSRPLLHINHDSGTIVPTASPRCASPDSRQGSSSHCPRVGPASARCRGVLLSLCHHEPRFLLRVVQRAGARFPVACALQGTPRPTKRFFYHIETGVGSTSAALGGRVRPSARLGASQGHLNSNYRSLGSFTMPRSSS